MVLARRLLLIAVLLVSVLPVLGLGRVASVAAAGCNYDGWGHFTGDCYFDPIPDDSSGCQVNYQVGTYTNGCQIRPEAIASPLPAPTAVPSPAPGAPSPSPASPELRSHFWSPVDLGGGCTPLDGGFYCPFEGSTYDPAPGYSCTYDDANANWTCKSPGTPGGVNCAYVEADGVQNCAVEGGAPIPSALPSPAASCGVAANLLCNGDFSDPVGTTAANGAWYQLPQAPSCSVDVGLKVEDGRQHFGGGDGGSCQTVGFFARELRQNFTAPAELAGAAVTFSFAVDLDPGTRVWNVYTGGNGDYSSWSYHLYANGTGQSDLFPGLVWTCDKPNGPNVYKTTGAAHCTAVVSFGPGAISANASYGFSMRLEGGLEGYADNLVLTATWAGMPSPSPSPGGGAEGGTPAWSCAYNGTADFGCTPPPDPATAAAATPGSGAPVLENCVFVSGVYVCNGPPPPAGAPSPSGSPGPSGSPAPSGSPGPSPGGSSRPKYGPTPGLGGGALPGAGSGSGGLCVLGTPGAVGTPTAYTSTGCREAPTGAGIGAALAPLYQKEPIGTIMQVGNYLSEMGGQFSTVPSGPVAVSGGASGTGIWTGLNVATISAQVYTFFDWCADMLDSYSVMGMNGTGFIKLFFNVSAVFLLIRAVRRSVIIAA